MAIEIAAAQAARRSVRLRPRCPAARPQPNRSARGWRRRCTSPARVGTAPSDRCWNGATACCPAPNSGRCANWRSFRGTSHLPARPPCSTPARRNRSRRWRWSAILSRNRWSARPRVTPRRTGCSTPPGNMRARSSGPMAKDRRANTAMSPCAMRASFWAICRDRLRMTGTTCCSKTCGPRSTGALACTAIGASASSWRPFRSISGPGSRCSSNTARSSSVRFTRSMRWGCPARSSN